jgi:hypothetical protein
LALRVRRLGRISIRERRYPDEFRSQLNPIVINILTSEQQS